MNIGVIGFGNRISSLVEGMVKAELGVKLAAITEINEERARKIMNEKGLSGETPVFYEDADEMLNNEKLDGVLIGTRCSLHTKMAKKVLAKNLPLFLEKPIATSMEDLLALKEAYEKSQSPVLISFPLRVMPIVKLVKEIVDSGKIGTIEHVQAYNNVPYGGVYYHSWYRDEAETGGLFLQKATHDFDYINYVLGIKPVDICAMKSKQIFKGDKPAGLKCKDCEEYRTCPESIYVLKTFKDENPEGEYCSLAVDTGNEDSGSALIRYETGMHVAYSQNFFARKAAGKRGARFLGYKGTIEFDWYTEEVKVFMHETSRVETYKLQSSSEGHVGGDKALEYNFIGMMQGTEKSSAPMEDGLLSALMCIKAKESAETDTFQRIEY